jgi:HK97 family phage prohead protease
MPDRFAGLQVRALQSEARADSVDGGPVVSGVGIVYGEWTELWPGFRERIMRGAVNKAPMVKSYFNHDPDKVLSTLDSNPPLKLRETEKGLWFTSPIPPTSYGKDLEINRERGNIRGASFAFSVPQGGDRMWQDDSGIYHREINSLELYEIGPVTDPAYIQTSAALRSAKAAFDTWVSEQAPSEHLVRATRLRLMEMDT